MSPCPTLQALLSQSAPNASSPDLLITFPSGLKIHAPGTPAHKPSTTQTPTFSLRTACLRTHVPGARYMVVALDIDAPSPSLPLAAPVLHYLHTDLTAVAPPTNNGGAKGTLVAPLTSWQAPAPSTGFSSAPHRYVFLVWEQPVKLCGEQVREKLGIKGEGGVWRKTKWDVEGVVRKLGLGDVVAGTWMCVSN
ncbi:hypothetical protein BU23DRAFT_529928 [Bimuria novae-zelandiae CBS 107.79]|uniref:PEBP-like protein n=1 Tax=Bimuria novae-zelandiae CBS 107.79 TaxID=1447943 RepID=A0A6A5VE55_9PLEO|nr:hypothetical protein BU23DRAFT_529928 [Bimuria novae-zelandiae CBS 107.79]